MPLWIVDPLDEHGDEGEGLAGVQYVSGPNTLFALSLFNGVLTFSDVALQSFLTTNFNALVNVCLLYTSPSPRDLSTSRMPSSA